jgi:hypothetical protein
VERRIDLIGVDSTGVKVTKRGEGMRKKRQGYIRVHGALPAQLFSDAYSYPPMRTCHRWRGK